ncbi:MULTISPECIES: lipoprotein insertase outer membrane protein LolB [Hydrogenophaga]|jgi:outer membrane lipoprotein LolB|uniref:lipoprotein insertase outer membrane protein LolB n=1 Tax=Hydrogenophaga TaxID=47420 RepID=UPI000A01EA58|nr:MULTISPECIES: lipoprotein insertase outer membrane protein LolB [Hydrogenophaga]
MTRADRGRLALLGVVAMTLAGCATSRPKASKDTSFWSGRLALTVHSEPPQSYSAGFELRGAPAAGELQLTSPLGTVLASVHWSPQGAELRQGVQRTRRPSLDELTADLGGTPLPVAALFGWLQGQTADASGWNADLSRHSEGRVVARRLQPLPTAELRLVFQP